MKTYQLEGPITAEGTYLVLGDSARFQLLPPVLEVEGPKPTRLLTWIAGSALATVVIIGALNRTPKRCRRSMRSKRRH